AGEPAPGEVLPGVRDATGSPVLQLRHTAACRREVLLRMRDAGQRISLRAAARLARGLHAETPRRAHHQLEGGGRGEWGRNGAPSPGPLSCLAPIAEIGGRIMTDGIGITRRRWLQGSIALGGLAVATPLGSTLAAEELLKWGPGLTTPATVAGPFYPLLSKPVDRDADLTVISGRKD